MANSHHLQILRQGVDVWNQWRKENSDETPDLSEAELSNVHLRGAKLLGANLRGAKLMGADLRGANLFRGDLQLADLTSADLTRANLSGASLLEAKLIRAKLISADLSSAWLEAADLSNADLTSADLSTVHLGDANLSHADLTEANLTRTYLVQTNFADAICAATRFINLNLSYARALDTIQHLGPSDISVSTVYNSRGKIPTAFLEGCGVPDTLIQYIPSLIGAAEPIQFYSCFISHSHKDEQFARRLHSRLREARLRVWFAPEDVLGGKKLDDQIDQAIRIYDKLLIVLSQNSMSSTWVETELQKARQKEIREKRRVLFPIRLVNFAAIQQWQCFDADTGKDLAREIREYYIPDFSNWKNHDAFEKEFTKLLEGLKADVAGS